MTSPSRIAILGASTDRAKFGNKAVRAYLHAGWEVLPVNPREAEIEGLAAYPSIAGVPGPLDRISIYLPPAVTRGLVADVAARGAREVWLNPGAGDEALVAAFRDAGVEPISGCSIVDIGLSPSQFR